MILGCEGLRKGLSHFPPARSPYSPPPGFWPLDPQPKVLCVFLFKAIIEPMGVTPRPPAPLFLNAPIDLSTAPSDLVRLKDFYVGEVNDGKQRKRINVDNV